MLTVAKSSLPIFKVFQAKAKLVTYLKKRNVNKDITNNSPNNIL